jgi:hypothetical protein
MPIIINSVRTADAGRGRELAFGLTGRVLMLHGGPGEIQELRYSLPYFSPTPVGKR